MYTYHEIAKLTGGPKKRDATTAHVFKTPEPICIITFGKFQRCFVATTSVKSVLIKFITKMKPKIMHIFVKAPSCR